MLADKWKENLNINKNNCIEDTVVNLTKILNQDENLSNFAYSINEQKVVITGPLPWKRISDSKMWNRADRLQLIFYLDTHYRRFSDRTLSIAFSNVTIDRQITNGADDNWKERLTRNHKNEIEDISKNVAIILEYDKKLSNFAYCKETEAIVITGPTPWERPYLGDFWCEFDKIKLRNYLADIYRDFSPKNIYIALAHVAIERQIEKLKKEQ